MGFKLRSNTGGPKQTSQSSDIQKYLEKELAARGVNRAAKEAKQKPKEKVDHADNYNKALTSYKSDKASISSDEEGLKNVKGFWNTNSAKNQIFHKKSRINKFEHKTYNYDKKNHPERVEGHTPSTYGDQKLKGKSVVKKQQTPTIENKVVENKVVENKIVDNKVGEKPKNKQTTGSTSYDSAFANRGKEYSKMDKSTYIKEAKRQSASKKKTGKWDATRKKAKSVETVKSVKGSRNTNTVGTVTAKKKLTKSQQLRAKGEKALKDGDKKGALATKRKYDAAVKKEKKG